MTSDTAELYARVLELEGRLDSLDATLDHVEELLGALEDDDSPDPGQWAPDTPVLALGPPVATLEELRAIVPRCHRPAP